MKIKYLEKITIKKNCACTLILLVLKTTTTKAHAQQTSRENNLQAAQTWTQKHLPSEIEKDTEVAACISGENTYAACERVIDTLSNHILHYCGPTRLTLETAIYLERKSTDSVIFRPTPDISVLTKAQEKIAFANKIRRTRSLHTIAIHANKYHVTPVSQFAQDKMLETK